MDDTKTPEQLAADEAAAAEAQKAAEAAAAADTKKAKTRKPVKARVLTDCAHGKANEVVLVDPDLLKADSADNGLHQLDADPAAVAYAESLAKPASQG